MAKSAEEYAKMLETKKKIREEIFYSPLNWATILCDNNHAKAKAFWQPDDRKIVKEMTNVNTKEKRVVYQLRCVQGEWQDHLKRLVLISDKKERLEYLDKFINIEK